jgi:L-lactate dehydrogenase complex protein LldE
VDVSIFVPCFIDQLYPNIALDMVDLLRKMGCNVNYEPNQTCCGQPAFNAGATEPAQQVAAKFLADFANSSHPIICPSASCVGFIRNHYRSIFAMNSSLLLEVEALQIYELSEFLVQHPSLELLQTSVKPLKVMYHDACAALRECHIKEEPRQLLKFIEGLEVYYPDDGVCCGFGGTFATKYETISVAMGKKKIRQALKLGVDGIVSTDMSCLMHLDGYIQQQKIPLQVWHIATLLNQREASQSD